MLGITIGNTTSMSPLSQALVPIMSSYSTDDIGIIYSTPLYSNTPAWGAFDGKLVANSYFHSVNNPSYPLYLGFYNNKHQSQVTSIMINAQEEGSYIYTTRTPKRIDVQGSNDGTAWYTYATFTSDAAYRRITYTIPKYDQWYYWNRIYIYSANGDTYCTIGELQFYGYYR